METVIYYLAAAGSLVAAGHKLWQTRGEPRSPGLRYLVGVLAALGLAAALLAPGTLRAASRIEPIPNLTRLAGNSATMIAVFAMLGMLACSAHPAERARRRMRAQLLILVPALVAMVVLLAVSGTRFVVEFVDAYGDRPTVAAYLMVYLSYATWGLVGIVVLIRRVVRYERRRFRAAGMRVLAAGAVLGLCWSTWKISMTLFRAVSGHRTPLEASVSSLLSALAVACIALGATLTAWGPRLAATAPARWARWTREYRQLGPLWSALITVFPDKELGASRAGARMRRYRRVIEIRDCHLALRVYQHPDVADHAEQLAVEAGLAEQAHAAVVEAAVLAAALDAYREGRAYHEDPSTAESPGPVGRDVDAEVRWLIEVAKAFRASPLVAAVRAEASGSVVSDA
ncbi:MAB_1171c family putative transporter [Amycolatopsis sp. H20-H5]|uniref:MAB_1171c family putative transporter n=1 Tax=Amycolatopsis sp. H20-H5 TaxID=3046309 RepID=UPI002DB9013F|nr:MAB_1171c family putative transporter [Amycolatopsis sp. H20-H5]MEC3980922.1 MAB_1171c family putative transporter [Amycolatopsis sp. H20-H5]